MLLVASACGEPAREPTPLRVAFDLYPGYFPGLLAETQGVFDSLGVRVSFTIPENTARMLAAFGAESYDVVVASLADVVPVLDRLPTVRIVMCSDESAGADVVVAVPGIRSVRDLRGRRIGLKMGGFSELFVREMLATARLTSDDVELVDLDGSAIGDALKAGRIDAGQTWDPYLTTLQAEGFRPIFSSEAVPGLIVQCAFSLETVVAERFEELARFIDGWFIGQARLLADPAAAKRALAGRVQRAEAELSLDGIRFFDRRENRRRFDTADGTSPLAETLRRHEAFFGSLGLLRTPIDPGRLIDARFIR